MGCGARLVEEAGAAWIVGGDPVEVDTLAARLRAEGRAVSDRLACVVVRQNGRIETSYTRLCTHHRWEGGDPPPA